MSFLSFVFFLLCIFFASSVGSPFDKKFYYISHCLTFIIDFKFFDNNFNTMKTVMVLPSTQQ